MTVLQMRIKNKILVILGPTASGKSDLAISLAKKYDGEIISADSRQVYRGMDIGTGKVTKREQRLVPHHLLDVASPKKNYTVHHFQRDAKKAIADILRRGKVPILCGGTGFWIDAVLSDAKLPAVEPNLELRKKLSKLTTAQLYARLKKLDPARARSIDRHNPVRLIRALEIVMTTKKPVPPHTGRSHYDSLLIGIRVPKKTLQKRINKRILSMMRNCLEKEVSNLVKKYSWDLPALHGIGYREWQRYFNDDQSKAETIAAIQQATRNFAKRQMTWIKKIERTYPIRWITSQNDAQKLIKNFLEK